MKKIYDTNTQLKRYKEFQNNISKVQPGDNLFLKIIQKENGYEDVFATTKSGKILGEFFSEQSHDLYNFVKYSEKFKIESVFKKHIDKEDNLKSIVVNVSVESEENFDYDAFFNEMKNTFTQGSGEKQVFTNGEKYIVGFVNESLEFKASINKFDKRFTDVISDYDVANLYYKDGIFEICNDNNEIVGYLSKLNSDKIIQHYRNPDFKVSSFFEVKYDRDNNYKIRIEISSERKKYLKRSYYLQDKSLLIPGVELCTDDGRLITDNGKNLLLDDSYVPPPPLPSNQNTQRKNNSGCAGVFISIILIIMFAGYKVLI